MNIKFTKNSTILLSCILLNGCFTANNLGATGTIATVKQTSKAVGYTNTPNIYAIGGTYDSMSNHPTNTPSCLQASTDANNIIIHSPQAALDFSQEQTLHSVQKALGVDFSLTAGWGPFTIHKSYSYAKTSRDDSYSLNLNYMYRLSGSADFKDAISQQGESALTSEARNRLHYSALAFRQMCGDGFISEAIAGSSVLIRLKLQFDSSTEKKSFTSNFTQIGGLNNILDNIRNNSKQIHYSLSAQGIQVGGNPNLLDQLFIHNGGYINSDGYPTLDCGSSTSITSACVNIINQVLDYVRGLQTQFTSVDSYYISQPTVSSWAQAGIRAGSVNPSPDIESAMYQLTNLYHNDEADNLFIQNYQIMLKNKNILSTQMETDLTQLSNNYNALLNIYHNPEYRIMDCYNGFVSDDCLEVRDKIVATRQNILNTPYLNNLLIYLKSHQYLLRLWITPTLQSDCELVPITNDNYNLYAVNCDGQISGSDSINEGISITHGLMGEDLRITNLHFSYLNDNTQHNISYFFQNPLVPDNDYEGVFFGIGNINIDNQYSFYTDDFFLINILH